MTDPSVYLVELYRVFQEENLIFWEVIVSVIPSKILRIYICVCALSERFPR
jgi:hypothetical protein